MNAFCAFARYADYQNLAVGLHQNQFGGIADAPSLNANEVRGDLAASPKAGIEADVRVKSGDGKFTQRSVSALSFACHNDLVVGLHACGVRRVDEVRGGGQGHTLTTETGVQEAVWAIAHDAERFGGHGRVIETGNHVNFSGRL